MTSSKFIKMVAANTNYSQKAIHEMLDAVEAVMVEALKSGESFKIMDINMGTADVGERTARNPQTGEAVTVPAHKRVTLKASKGLKDACK